MTCEWPNCDTALCGCEDHEKLDNAYREMLWLYAKTEWRGIYGVDADDYRNAPSGIGPYALDWDDKPHRLLYDLCREVKQLQFAVKNLNDICHGEGGTVEVDPSTGMPLPDAPEIE